MNTPSTLLDSLPKNDSPSLMEGVHWGFIADDSLGAACQAAGEAALRKDVAGAVRAVLMFAKSQYVGEKSNG